MMPTFPSSPLKFRTAGFPLYGFKAGFSEEEPGYKRKRNAARQLGSPCAGASITRSNGDPVIILQRGPSRSARCIGDFSSVSRPALQGPLETSPACPVLLSEGS